MSRPLRVGVVGAGMIGRRHIATAIASADAELVGVADTLPADDPAVASLPCPYVRSHRDLIAQCRPDALVVVGDPMFWRHRVRLIEQTLRSRVPSIYGDRGYVANGGLMSYLSLGSWHWRAAAGFVTSASSTGFRSCTPRWRSSSSAASRAPSSCGRGSPRSTTPRSRRSR